jgi:hypothetical protein
MRALMGTKPQSKPEGKKMERESSTRNGRTIAVLSSDSLLLTELYNPARPHGDRAI